MSEELEIGLTRLAADNVPAALETVQGKVLEQVAGLRATAPQLGTGIRVVAVMGALLMGVAGGLMPNGAEAQPSLAPISGASELAPATILLGQL